MAVRKTENSTLELSELTRKDFLKGFSLSIAAVFTGKYVVKPLQKIVGPLRNLEAKNGNEEDIAEINIMLNFIKKIYGVDIYNGETIINRYMLNNLKKMDFNNTVLPDNYDLHKQLSITEIRKELSILINELIKYPSNMFGKRKVSFIRLIPEFNHIADILDHNSEYEGIVSPFTKGGHTQSTTTGKKKENLSEIDKQKGWSNTFNHEMFHSFCLMNKSVYQRFFSHRIPSLEDYAQIYDKDKDDLSDIREDYNPSFFEDIANLAGLLMDSNQHKEFLIRIKTEDEEAKKLLQAKYNAIKAIYYDFSDGLMDEQYWDDLLNDRVVVSKNNGVLFAEYWINKTRHHIKTMKQKLRKESK